MKKNRGEVITADFRGVKGKGEFEVIPEDNYQVKVDNIEKKDGNEYPYLNWELLVSAGEHKGSRLWHTTSLSPKSLWNLRATLEALGEEVPDSKMQIDLPSYKGKEMGVSVEIEVYKKKEKNRVVDVFPLEDLDGKDKESGDDDDDEKPDFDGMELDELITYAEKHDIELTKKQKKDEDEARKAIQEVAEEE